MSELTLIGEDAILKALGLYRPDDLEYMRSARLAREAFFELKKRVIETEACIQRSEALLDRAMGKA